MASDAREFARIRNALLPASTAGWVLLLLAPHTAGRMDHCPAMNHQAHLTWPGSNSLSWFFAGWLLMLAAMMAPVLVSPVTHIWLRSFKRRRARSVLLFTAGYVAVWMAAGALALVMELAVQAWTPQTFMPVLPAAAAAVAAVVWQFSPIKQRCLNRCHAHPVLAAFGRRADLDAFSFGVTHGIWCAGSCWALMLLPLLLPAGHVPAMVLISLLIFSERLEAPRPPGWRWRGVEPVIRMAVAQIRLQAKFPAAAR